MEILAVRDLTFTYPRCSSPAVKNVSFTIERGEMAVLCGATDPEKYTPGLSEVWAKKNGAPIEYLVDADPERLLKKLAAAADYIVFILRDEQWLKNFMMQYKMRGKHGTVIKL